MIRIRVDDFPHTKDGEKGRHSLAAFREFDKRLRESIGGKRYLLGVIPGRCTVDDVLFLRNETDCAIGMHGIDHDEKQLDIHQNEFPSYLSQADVCGKMVVAAIALDNAVGRKSKIYMPPRNRIDFRTVNVLASAGFSHFTAGPETDIAVVTRHSDRVIMSTPPHEYGRTDEMWERQSHKDLALRNDANDTVLTLHWTWETNIGLHHMVKFLTAIPLNRFADFGDQ